MEQHAGGGQKDTRGAQEHAGNPKALALGEQRNRTNHQTDFEKSFSAVIAVRAPARDNGRSSPGSRLTGRWPETAAGVLRHARDDSAKLFRRSAPP